MTHQSLFAVTCVIAAVVGAIVPSVALAQVTTDVKTGRHFVQRCCGMTFDFYVDGKKVSHEDMLVFDTKQRSISVDATEPRWKFVFRIQATPDLAKVRWDAGIGGEGDAVRTSPRTVKIGESIEIDGKCGAMQSRCKVVARATRFGIPLPMPGEVLPPVITSNDPGGTYPPLKQHAQPLQQAASPQDASDTSSGH